MQQLTAEHFEPHVGERFRIVPGDGAPFEATLSSCTAAGEPPVPEFRKPFSLLFHASGGELVGQQICAVEHPALGRLDIFLVPLGPDERGMRYEAVFN